MAEARVHTLEERATSDVAALYEALHSQRPIMWGDDKNMNELQREAARQAPAVTKL